MKIINKNYKTNFQAGLSKQIRSEISSCDLKKINKEFAKNNIKTDFKNNKLIAWSSLKCMEIIKNINNRFNLNLGLPKGIFVEDFHKLNIENKDATGICNVFPSILYENSNIIVPEKTIFFNNFSSQKDNFWENIDLNSDLSKEQSISATDFFLETFLHEFSHVIHENHLLENLGNTKFINIISKIMTPEFKNKFDNKYFMIIYRNCCQYATKNPMETIACDLSNRIIESLDKNTLLPMNKFLEKNPYKKYTLIEAFLSPIKDKKYDQIIRRFWNGNFK